MLTTFLCAACHRERGVMPDVEDGEDGEGGTATGGEGVGSRASRTMRLSRVAGSPRDRSGRRLGAPDGAVVSDQS